MRSTISLLPMKPLRASFLQVAHQAAYSNVSFELSYKLNLMGGMLRRHSTRFRVYQSN
ncbi:hypothetical protein NVSP9465_03810 [Novosphingobium sp. CECT 9465]|nr:hypothetical protein NVSP9465_03810 [Novosphingobium sp. CECT 9465]